jgi:hypothetical protein
LKRNIARRIKIEQTVHTNTQRQNKPENSTQIKQTRKNNTYIQTQTTPLSLQWHYYFCSPLLDVLEMGEEVQKLSDSVGAEVTGNVVQQWDI